MTRLEERRSRVGSLLHDFYRIDAKPEAGEPFESNLDSHGFDALQYFDSTVSSKDMVAVRKRAKDLDVEVQELDVEMQSLVHENYSKFTHAAGVIKQMSFAIDGLEPDMVALGDTIGRLNECQHRVEDGIGPRATQIDVLLKHQRICRKLQVLFALPNTLKRCLDNGHYGQAVEAYCSCSDFLRQYKHVPTFLNVLQEVEHQMHQIASALETRLRAPYLSCDEAVNSSVTLLDMGKDQVTVAQEYLKGRVAVLQKDLERCFDAEPLRGFRYQDLGGPEKLTRDQEDLQRPESVALHGACWRAAELYAPQLCDAVEGFQKLQEGRAGASQQEGGKSEAEQDAFNEKLLSDFTTGRLEELCGRFFRMIEENCPPTRVLVACVHLLRDGLRRLHESMPTLVNDIFLIFLRRTASCKLRRCFAAAASSIAQDLLGLHSECRRLQECTNSGLDDVLEQIARTEQSLVKTHFLVLTDCQPLLSLLGFEQTACKQFVEELREQLVMLSYIFVDACYRYIGEAPFVMREEVEPALLAGMPPELQALEQLDWSGLFALALVRIGRHLEMKAFNKVWDVARELFAEGIGPIAAGATLVQHQPSVRAARNATGGVITHYVIVSGQRLAQFIRNFVQNKNWTTVREPKAPSPFVEKIVAKEVHAFDAQLARILGDPRKPKPPERRPLRHTKTEMELELERLVVRKRKVFDPVPFNRNGAVVGILRIAFKALYEYVREESFAKYGVQQIQVDTAFLAELLRDFVEMEDAGALESLLDEAVVSAQQRGEGASLMDADAVEALVQERKASGPALA